MSKKQKIVIVGGGFGGIKVALELAKEKSYEVKLISDRENFRYYPTLYHAATGGKLSQSQIPLSEIFAGKAVEIIIDNIAKIDRAKKQIKGKKSYEYDKLVLSLGVLTNFFGIEGLDKYAYGIKSIEEAQRLKNHLHQQLIDTSKPDVSYVIIGGGPTGVELAGNLPHYMQHVMKKHGLPRTKLHIDLVEGADRLVSKMPKPYSRAVEKRLRKLGVNLILGKRVEAETAEEIMVSGHSIKSHTVVWTSGVTNHPFFQENNFYITDAHKAAVNKYMEAEEDVYVIGDNADTPYSGMAQTALYDAKFVAGNLKRMAHNRQLKTYKPKKPIYIIPVGPGWAAVLWGSNQIYGLGGWMLREAADFVGYKDYEPWWKAGSRWLSGFGGEEDCVVCHPKAES